MQSGDEGSLDDYPLIVEVLRATGRPILGTGVVDRYLEAASADGSIGPRPVVERAVLPLLLSRTTVYTARCTQFGGDRYAP